MYVLLPQGWSYGLDPGLLHARLYVNEEKVEEWSNSNT